MDLKSIINKIKLAITEEVEVKMTDVKTQDGTILSFDGDLVVGVEIFVVDENGKTPAEGEFILEDGTKIVAVAGVVEELEAPEQPIEAPAPAPDAMPAEMPVAASEVETLSIEDLALKVKSLEDENLQIREILEQLAESFSKETFNKEVKMSKVIKPETIKVEVDNQVNLSRKNNDLNNIFKNMYRNK